MKEYAKSIASIEGHTCHIGDEAYNIKLGERRAQAVADYLISTGIEAERVSIKSFGSSLPTADPSKPQNLPLNRRVEYKIRIGDD